MMVIDQSWPPVVIAGQSGLAGVDQRLVGVGIRWAVGVGRRQCWSTMVGRSWSMTVADDGGDGGS